MPFSSKGRRGNKESTILLVAVMVLLRDFAILGERGRRTPHVSRGVMLRLLVMSAKACAWVVVLVQVDET